ncbi:MAG: hypothetical protein LBV69_01575 [Bacteroidales bacterium]|jgi:antitoxin component YwqK of YwqJK toxin-antitoxin module|nr:hypothetical protein [Bacteroidales bacterium]
MKFKHIFYIIIILISTIVSCNNNSKLQDKLIEKLPIYVQQDSLITTHEVKIIDTTSTGTPRIIHFVCQKDTTIQIEKIYHNSGKIYIEGELKAGKRHGLWKAWYENDNLWSIGNYQNGLKEGLEETYYPNGQVRYSKIYKNNKENGLAKYFDEKGNLISEVEYLNDSIISKKEY